MSDPYAILTVAPKDETLEREDMGSKKKFWYRDGNDRHWLFKTPRPDTGEHWAEKIAAEIADVLRIPHAEVELAQFDEIRGSVTESFTDNRSISFAWQPAACDDIQRL